MIAPLVNRQIEDGDQFGQIFSVAVVGVQRDMLAGLTNNPSRGDKVLVHGNAIGMQIG